MWITNHIDPGDPPMIRLCPLCTLRPAAVVAPACIVCAGHGTLTLGPSSLREYTPATVSTATHLALEVEARKVDRRPDARSADPAPAIAAVLDRLARAGLLVPPKAPAPDPHPGPGTLTGPPAALVHRAIGTRPDATDQRMIRAHPYVPTPTERWHGPPLLSRGFYPASLPRVGDPVPFDQDTLSLLSERTKRRYDARAIVFYLTGTAP